MEQNELVNNNIFKQIEDADRTKWDYETYISFAQEVAKIKGYSNWIIGKLASEYSKKWGDVTKFARDARLEPSSVGVYKMVYEKYQQADPTFKPDGFVPWGVLQMASTTENPIETLNELHDASANKINQAFAIIKSRQTGKIVPQKPRVKLQFNEEDNIWKIVIEQEDITKIDWTDIKKQLMEYFAKVL